MIAARHRETDTACACLDARRGAACDCDLGGMKP